MRRCGCASPASRDNPPPSCGSLCLFLSCGGCQKYRATCCCEKVEDGSCIVDGWVVCCCLCCWFRGLGGVAASKRSVVPVKPTWTVQGLPQTSIVAWTAFATCANALPEQNARVIREKKAVNARSQREISPAKALAKQASRSAKSLVCGPLAWVNNSPAPRSVISQTTIVTAKSTTSKGGSRRVNA